MADWQELWSLSSDDRWKLLTDEDGRELFPIWPHRIFAELCAHGEWDGCVAGNISLAAWLDEWIPELVARNRLIAIFPLPEGAGIPVEPQRFEHDLRTELSLMED